MLFIDSREVPSGIPEMLKRTNIPCIIQMLEVGDYIIDNSYVIERKEASDYIQSLMDGRLSTQLYNMSYSFPLSYVVIIGAIEPVLMERNLSRKMYISSLIGSSLKRAPDGKQGQVVTVNLLTDYDFALFLKTLHEKVSLGDFTRLPKFERATMSEDDYRIKILTSLPHIGQKRAEEILKQHLSLQNAFSTLIYQPELFNVKGVTPELRQIFHKIIVSNYGEK